MRARADAALPHPNTLAIYDVGETNSRHGVVAELLEGGRCAWRIAFVDDNALKIMDAATGRVSAILRAICVGRSTPSRSPTGLRGNRTTAAAVIPGGEPAPAALTPADPRPTLSTRSRKWVCGPCPGRNFRLRRRRR